jgi:hypothetical protein
MRANKQQIQVEEEERGEKNAREREHEKIMVHPSAA